MAVRLSRALASFTLACAALTLSARALRAQQHDTQDTVEMRAKRARQGAGLRVGLWNVGDLPGGTNTSWPMFEGYFQKGLDQHLVIESSAGVWRRQVSASGGSDRAFVVPILTQLKLYPTTTPQDQLEPYVAGGIGLTLGVEQSVGGGAGLLGGGGGTSTVAGIGVKGSAGVEYRFSRAFGVAGYAGYQYVYFLNPMAGTDTFKGFLVGAGLTYRFQY